MSPQRYIFRRQRRWYSSPLLIFILVGVDPQRVVCYPGLPPRGDASRSFMPTPTPTRVASSFALEAETHFQAGNLDAAIASYQEAISINPQNGRLYAELARILTYSTESQTTDKEKQERFEQALAGGRRRRSSFPRMTARPSRCTPLPWIGMPVYLNVYLQKNEEGRANC